MNNKTPIIDKITESKLAPVIITTTPAPVAREPNWGFSSNKANPNRMFTPPRTTKIKIWINILSRVGEIKVKTE